MKKPLFGLLLFVIFISDLHGQSCNKLGAWLWHLEITGFENYEKLADSLSNLGVKRIFVKVADGGMDSIKWPELVDKSIPAIFENYGIEAWAWSYNYPGNEINQAKAMHHAAKSGYKGYILDVESQFDGKRQALSNIFGAFYTIKKGLFENGIVSDSFPLYCTTWGNPMIHNFYLDAIDPYVDGYLAQTYVENWGFPFMENLEYWIDQGNIEYNIMGATKPVHHIVSTEKGNISPDQLNRFIRHAGEETSVWPIPGSNTSLNIWDSWRQIDWNLDFCVPTFVYDKYVYPNFFYPNPARDIIHINEDDVVAVDLRDINGRKVFEKTGLNIQEINIQSLAPGIYIITILKSNGSLMNDKVVVS